MSDGRYYTPDYSEFHVGFEFESLEKTGASDENKQWKVLEYFKTDNGWHNTQYLPPNGIALLISNGKIRVKYLDEEDIVSLGWVLDGNRFIFPLQRPFVKGRMNSWEHELEVFYIDNNTLDIIIYNVEDDRIVSFRGNVKNKSRMRLVMEMLGITKQ